MTTSTSELGIQSTQPNLQQSDKSAVALAQHYQTVRRLSQRLCQPLLIEDYCLQAMPETSPAKWHLAHTTWFFETFILKPYVKSYQVYNAHFEYLFNSYYNAVGAQYPRAQRGLLSRPSVDQVFSYREYVDKQMHKLFTDTQSMSNKEVLQRITLGCHHEQQHQELFFTDLKYCWYQNPILPAYQEKPLKSATPTDELRFSKVSSGLYTIGQNSTNNFSFDNEQPAHQVYLQDYLIGQRLVTNGEFLSFMIDGGYDRPDLWLADGWTQIQEKENIHAPLYWQQLGQEWFEYTLHGLQPLDLARPVAHISAYESDAYARWADCRLPTEQEWEVYVEQPADLNSKEESGQFLQDDHLHPINTNKITSALIGRLWQWTSSAYSPYPGFKTAEGAIGEYNGKFMANQLVLRGGSCVTSKSHYRHSYRNFFYAKDKWQFTGICLAKDP